jgi:hypothetical protein
MASQKLPETARALLVRTLAAEQVPWWPVRQYADHGPAIYDWRTSPRLRLGGGRGNQREAASYWRAELISRGLLLATGRLSPRGKLLARSWTWPFVPSELRLVVRRMLAAAKRGDVHEDSPDGLNLVPEELISGSYWDAQTELLQRCLLPWLCDGVIVSFCEVPGGTYYAIADTSLNLFKLCNEVIDDKIDFSPELSELYQTESKQVRNAMLADGKKYNELGIIPIAMTELKSKRDCLDPAVLRKIKPIFKSCDG